MYAPVQFLEPQCYEKNNKYKNNSLYINVIRSIWLTIVTRECEHTGFTDMAKQEDWFML